MAKIKTELSMLEATELLIKRKIKPQKFSKIAKEVFELMGLSDAEDLDLRTAQLYTDLSLSGKFVATGEDMWDLKSRQLYETANYDTYELDFETEEPITLLGEDAPVAALISPDRMGIVDEEEEEAVDPDENEVDEAVAAEDVVPLISDDYGDDSDAEVESEENDAHAGLSIYKEEEME